MRNLLLLSLLAFAALAHGQQQTSLLYNAYTPMKAHQILLDRAQYPAAAPDLAAKTTNLLVFDTAQWKTTVDDTWGSGVSDLTKLSIFDQFWLPVDSNYACFVQLPLYNWDSIVNAMRAEINLGVSRGRFAGIIGKLMTYINDGHSHFYDYGINYGTSIFPGMPVFRGQSKNFGACITPLNDSLAMIYEAVPGHPFDLQKGDVLLGYNGVPWKELVKLILQYELPNACYLGSTDAATWHRYVQAAGENWYLFDTINIRKCDGSVVNFPVDLMSSTSYSCFCSDQMPVPGVPKLSYSDVYSNNRAYASGIVSGSRIGYVYMYDCLDMSGDSLYSRVRTLVEDSLVNGLIIDIRTNFGGGFGAFFKTFQYLNDGDVSWVGYSDRTNYADRYAMTNTPSSWYDLQDDDPMSWDKPVAILTGPNAVSAGDFLPILFKHCPSVRTFGKSTAGAYGAYMGMYIDNSNYYASRQAVNFYETSNPSYYLSHTQFPVDEPTWLKQDSVCSGVDNVVTEAMHWIRSTNSVQTGILPEPEINVYPNPSSGEVNIRITGSSPEGVDLRLFNMQAILLKSIHTTINTGENLLKLDLKDHPVAPGNYYLTVKGRQLGNSVRKLSLF